MWYYLLKPAATAAIYGWVRAHGDGGDARYRRLVSAALLFSLAGDILLMIPADLFLAGLAAFLVAHLFYVAAFGPGVPVGKLTAGLVPFAFAAGVLVRLVWPGVEPGLRVPVLGYAGVITIMAGSAVGRWLDGADGRTRRAATGASLFFISDAALALDRFRAPLAYASLIVLGTYYAAQLLIGLSVAANQRRSDPLPSLPGPG